MTPELSLSFCGATTRVWQGCQVLPQIFGQNFLILRPNSANNSGQPITKFSAEFGQNKKFTAKNRPEIQTFVIKFLPNYQMVPIKKGVKTQFIRLIADAVNVTVISHIKVFTTM